MFLPISHGLDKSQSTRQFASSSYSASIIPGVMRPVQRPLSDSKGTDPVPAGHEAQKLGESFFDVFAKKNAFGLHYIFCLPLMARARECMAKPEH